MIKGDVKEWQERDLSSSSSLLLTPHNFEPLLSSIKGSGSSSALYRVQTKSGMGKHFDVNILGFVGHILSATTQSYHLTVETNIGST